MECKLVFDITQIPFDWKTPSLGVIVFLAFLALAIINPSSYSITGSIRSRNYSRVFGVIGAIIAISWVFITLSEAWVTHEEFRRVVEQGDYKVIEGIVEDFIPMKNEQGAYEQFRVGNVVFRYSDYVKNGAFNTTIIKGGPIREGLQIRIGYVSNYKGNLILRLEIL